VKRIAILGRGAHTLPSYRVMLQLLSLQYDITIFCETPRREDWIKEAKGYRLKFLPGGKFPRRIRDLLMMIVLIREHLRNPFQLIHAHSTFPAGVIAVLMQKVVGIPAVVFLDGGEGVSFPEIQFGDLVSKRRAKINRWVINRAKEVVALTKFQRDLVIANLRISRKINVITRGVDDRMFTFSVKSLSSPVVFLSIGYLSPIKDPVTLIKTFAAILKKKEARLIHVGEDYTKGQIQELALQLGIADKISFEGHVGYEQTPAYYHRADILLVTSVFESQAVVAAEAMACGVLVCGTQVGMLADLAAICCVTVPTENPEGLANAVLELLEDQHRMATLRANAGQWSIDNNVEHTVSEIDELYKTLIR
jgi:glycosyltransferase involved in cell wall biosynthesis